MGRVGGFGSRPFFVGQIVEQGIGLIKPLALLGGRGGGTLVAAGGQHQQQKQDVTHPP